MKRHWILALLLLFLSGCNQDTSDSRIQELEATIERQASELAAQAIVMHPDFDASKSPLENFFSAADYWAGVTVDAGRGSCGADCAEKARRRREACEKEKDVQKRIDCFKDTQRKTTKCINNCSNK